MQSLLKLIVRFEFAYFIEKDGMPYYGDGADSTIEHNSSIFCTPLHPD